MQLEVIHNCPSTTTHPTPLLFVHGAFSDARVWQKHFLPYFADHGYVASALSLRGHGRSEGAQQLWAWRLADYVADVAQIASTFSAPPVVIGHSMGGMVLQKYLEQHPPIAGLALMASVPPQGLWPCIYSMMTEHTFLFHHMCLLSLLGPRYSHVDIMRRLLFSPDIPEAQLQEFFAYAQAESQWVSMDMMGWNPLRLRPKSLQAPVLVLGAEHDIFVPPALVKAAARWYGVEPHIFPMAHAMMLETQWETVADHLLKWVDRITQHA